MTNILALPELSIPCTIRTNEDWLDAVAYFDVNGNPVALDGIAFELQARASAESGDVFLDASTANGLLVLCAAGALVQPVTPGANYAIGDTVTLLGGTALIPAVLTVTALQLVYLTLGAAGTGHQPGDVLTLAGGVFSTAAQIKVDTVTLGGVIATWHMVTPGVYSVAPTTFTQGSTTGAGVGSTFTSPSWGVAAARMTSAGTYEVVPADPVAQAASSGLGGGATFDLIFVNNALCVAVPLASLTDYLMLDATVYEIRATADGYTAVVITGALNVLQGVTR